MEKTETSTSNNPGEIPMVGDHLALDLLNTEMRVGNEAVDLWRSGEDVHAWLERCGLVASVSIAAAEKQTLLMQARELRTLARQLIEQWKNGQMGDVRPLNKFLDGYTSAPQVTADDTGKLVLTRVAKADPVVSVLGPVAEAIAQLLTEGEVDLGAQDDLGRAELDPARRLEARPPRYRAPRHPRKPQRWHFQRLSPNSMARQSAKSSLSPTSWSISLPARP